MKIDNNLNVYSDGSLDKQQIKILKNAIKVCIVFAVIFTVLTIIFHKLYTLIVGYAVGSVIALTLFILTNKLIIEANYLDLKKTAKKIHYMYQLSYIFSLAIMLLIFKDFFVIIGLIIGLLLIKITSLFSLKTK